MKREIKSSQPRYSRAQRQIRGTVEESSSSAAWLTKIFWFCPRQNGAESAEQTLEIKRRLAAVGAAAACEYSE